MSRYLPLLIGWYSGQALLCVLDMVPGKQALGVCVHVTLFALVANWLISRREKE